jgi:hypothetical protein
MRRDQHARYEDGLDADGYAITGPTVGRFIHGSEADCGDFRPVTIGEAATSALDRVRLILNLSPATDSPIEAQLGACIIMFFERAGVPLHLCKAIDVRNAPDGLLLVPQFAWSIYRSDWAILSARRHGALLVECDGRDFHSSEAQKAHDAKKDQAALDYGFLTLRFTGSRIFRDAEGCAQKIYDAVHGN